MTKLVEGYNEGVTPDGCRWASMVRDGHVVWEYVDAKQESMEDQLRALPGFGGATAVIGQFGTHTLVRFIIGGSKTLNKTLRLGDDKAR